MTRTITLSGETALAVKYAIALARVKFPEFAELSDEDVLGYLIERGIYVSREVRR